MPFDNLKILEAEACLGSLLFVHQWSKKNFSCWLPYAKDVSHCSFKLSEDQEPLAGRISGSWLPCFNSNWDSSSFERQTMAALSHSVKPLQVTLRTRFISWTLDQTQWLSIEARKLGRSKRFEQSTRSLSTLTLSCNPNANCNIE